MAPDPKKDVRLVVPKSPIRRTLSPSEGRFSLWPWFVGAVLFIALWASFDVSRRRKPAPPPEFLAVKAIDGKADRRLALAYWQCAVQAVQWKYHYDVLPPDEPPKEFQLPNADARARAARMAYWRELRAVWLRPETWKTSYDIDVSWAPRAIRTVRDGLRYLLGK